MFTGPHQPLADFYQPALTNKAMKRVRTVFEPFKFHEFPLLFYDLLKLSKTVVPFKTFFNSLCFRVFSEVNSYTDKKSGVP